MKLIDNSGFCLIWTEAVLLTTVVFVIGLMFGFVLFDGSGYDKGFDQGLITGGHEAVYVTDIGVCFYDTFWFQLDEILRDEITETSVVLYLDEFRRVCVNFDKREGF